MQKYMFRLYALMDKSQLANHHTIGVVPSSIAYQAPADILCKRILLSHTINEDVLGNNAVIGVFYEWCIYRSKPNEL